ncbi:putative efflux system component YhbJ [Ktedonobacteria bacterium brp13]|nr:putative efflux system component YhbJ [Ktedonobacteria bacterium brp13]
MRRSSVILVPVLIFVAILAIVIGGGLYFYNGYLYYSTDDAQVAGKMLSISSTANGQLTTIVNVGDKVAAGQTVATVAGVSATGHKTLSDITSSISGTVVQSSAIQGQVVAAGTPLAQIANMDNPTVTAYIDESQLNNVKVGQQVDVNVDAFPGTTYNGHVQQIVQATAGTFSLIPSTDNTSGNFTKVSQRVPVIITLDGTSTNDLVPGLSATAKIHLH